MSEVVNREPCGLPHRTNRVLAQARTALLPRLLVLGQHEWERSPWRASSYPATEAGYARQGFKLVGWVRDTAALHPERRRFVQDALARGTHDRPEVDAELKRDLAHCPYTTHRLPFIDIDVAKEIPEDLRATVAAKAADYARALAREAPRHGLGHPAWTQSNDRGGLHGRMAPPLLLVSHPSLPEALARVLRRCAKAAGVPLLSDIRKKTPTTKAREKAGAYVFLDDTYFVAQAASRGRQWRLEKIPKPGGVYFPVELGAEGPATPGGEWRNGSPVDHSVLAAECQAIDEEAADCACKAAEARAALERLRATDPERASRLESWAPGQVEEIVLAEVERVRDCPKGARNNTLYLAAVRVGALVGGGSEIPTALEQVVAAALLADDAKPEKIRDTAKRGYESGLTTPEKPPLPKLDTIVRRAVTPRPTSRWTPRMTAAQDSLYARALDHLPEPKQVYRDGQWRAEHPPGYLAIDDARECRWIHGAPSCTDHGAKGINPYRCKRRDTCLNCSRVQSERNDRERRETWPLSGMDRVAVVRLEVSESTPPSELVAAVVALDHSIPLFDSRSGRARLTVKGYDHVLAIYDVRRHEAPPLARGDDLNIRQIQDRNRKRRRAMLSDLEAAQEDVAKRASKGRGVLWPEGAVRVVSLSAALDAVRDTENSFAEKFAEQVAAGCEEGMAHFPWLHAKGLHRPRLNDAAKALLPWPSERVMAPKRMAAALEKRHGVPLSECETMTGSVDGKPCYCRKPLDQDLVSDRSGKILAQRHGAPFWGPEILRIAKADRIQVLSHARL